MTEICRQCLKVGDTLESISYVADEPPHYQYDDFFEFTVTKMK